MELQSLWPFLYLAVRVLAVACLVHAILTKQDLYWMVMLGLGVLLGGIFSSIFVLIYAFTVFFPWLRGRGRAAGQALGRGLEAMKPLDVRVREAQEALGESDTLDRRAELAHLQARAGRVEEAQTTLQPLLSGVYADDPVVLLTSAQLDLARGRYAEAEARLQSVDLTTSAATRTRALTLLAHAQAEQNKPEADGTYQSALVGATSEEPRARYAAYLLRQGRPADAAEVLTALEKAEARATPLYLRQEREWFQMAADLRRQLRSAGK